MYEWTLKVIDTQKKLFEDSIINITAPERIREALNNHIVKSLDKEGLSANKDSKTERKNAAAWKRLTGEENKTISILQLLKKLMLQKINIFNLPDLQNAKTIEDWIPKCIAAEKRIISKTKHADAVEEHIAKLNQFIDFLIQQRVVAVAPISEGTEMSDAQ
jgi:hypothetical protein